MEERSLIFAVAGAIDFLAFTGRQQRHHFGRLAGRKWVNGQRPLMGVPRRSSRRAVKPEVERLSENVEALVQDLPSLASDHGNVQRPRLTHLDVGQERLVQSECPVYA